MKSYVPDTSVIIDKLVSKLIKSKEIEKHILLPNAVVAELEAQANRNRETGFLGLEELQTLQELKQKKQIKLEFVGPRPTPDQIRYAKAGEIDAMIRQLAYDYQAILITADKVQKESAKAFGLEVKFIVTETPKEELKIEHYFDEITMSIHLKEDCIPVAKKGSPGNWQTENLTKTHLTQEQLREFSKDIVEKAKMDPKSFIEISRPGSSVIQYKNYRIVIVRKPVADGLEITAIRPIKKLTLEEYKIPEQILNRIKTKAHGIIIAGETGSGKSTIAQAIAEHYSKNKKIVKTVESPRDLQLGDEITQYSKNFTSSEEIHDILFLSRPDNLIFDEIRDTPDFKLYIDLRLAGSNCIGVLHSAAPIDAIQRFISRMETGMIPSVLDTILFIQSGKIHTVLTLKMRVKVPSGMTESDLARPVVEVFDFVKDELIYEIYSYGEETVVVPVSEQNASPLSKLASLQLETQLRNYVSDVKVEMDNTGRATIYIPEPEIAKIIGKSGKRIEQIEKELGVRLTVKELKRQKNTHDFTVSEKKKFIIFKTSRNLAGKTASILVNNQFLLSSIISPQGDLKVNKKSQAGKSLLYALDHNEEIELNY